MSDLIISVSGLRGIVGESLTPDVAVRFVGAYASKLPAGPIVVGRDGRSSGIMLKQAIIAALTACGRDCIDADVAATPTVGVLVRQRNAAGAVQISASHNPPPYNGIKLFGPDGRVLDAVTGGSIRDTYLAGEAAWCSFDKIGSAPPESDPHADHLDMVLATVDVDAIRDLDIPEEVMPLKWMEGTAGAYVFDRKAYESARELHPAEFEKVSAHVETKPKKASVTIKLA